MRYAVLKTDGTREDIETEKPMELEELQKHVGGYIQFIRDGEVHLCLNEEGYFLSCL